MAEKEASLNRLDYSTVKSTSKRSMQHALLSAGWPPELVDQYLHKVRNKIKRLERLPASALILLNRVLKKFNNRIIFQDITLEIKPGEIFGFIGLSGTGKTTLLNLIVGFLEPDAGDVIIKLSDGSVTSIKQAPELVKTLFGFSTQDPSFYSKLTVKENLQHFGALYGISPAKLDAKADDLLNLVGLADSKDVIAQNLSGGMQKRLDIACAMVHEPKVLILDEPTADLDPLLRKQMWDLIKKINARGTTIIVASHFVGEIEAVCDRVAVLSNKTISQIGTVDEIIDVYAKDYALDIETKSKNYDSLIKGIKRLKDVKSQTVHDKNVLISTVNPKRTIAWLSKYVDKNKDQIVKLNLSKPTLSQVFEDIVKK